MRRFGFYSSAVLSISLFGIFCLSFSGLAQERISSLPNEKSSGENIVTQEKFDEIINQSIDKSFGRITRLIETIEYFPKQNAKAESVKTRISEIEPRRTREVLEIKSPKEDSRVEKIWDGRDLYQKRNDGEWKKSIADNKTKIDLSDADLIPAPEKSTYKFLGKENLNNQNALVYEKETRQTADEWMTRTAQFRVEYITKTRYWLDKNGLLLKEIKELKASNSKAMKRTTKTYFYDPGVKIEVPKI